MQSPLRTGVIFGAITGVVSALLTFVPLLCICAPVVTILGGAGAGITVARNERYGARAIGSGTMAGLVAGLVTGLAQSIAVVLFYRTPLGADAFAQVSQMQPAATTQELWIAVGILSFFVGLLDVGIVTGCAALGALFAVRIRHPQASIQPPRYPYPGTPPGYMPPRAPEYQPPAGYPPVPAPSAPPGAVAPPPAYPPPPSYYGHPDVTPPTPPAPQSQEPSDA